MQSEHRKIELQSPSDLTHLTSLIRAAALSKLDLHLPAQPSDSGSADDLRAQTAVLVDAFVAAVLGGMRSNISINGLEVVAAARGGGFAGAGEGAGGGEMEGVEMGETVQGVEEEEFEAFDDKLRGRLADAVARRDKLVAAISKHRRETPRAAARRFEEAFERENEAVLALGSGRVESAQGSEEGLLGVEVQREEEVRRNWERAVEGLGRLNKGLPETRARLERCGDVVGYLDGDKK